MGDKIEQKGKTAGAVANGEVDPENGDEAFEPVAPEAEPEADVDREGASPRVVDKRRFARLLGFGFGPGEKEADEEDDDPRAERLPSYVEELKERAERVQAEARAETDAARARLERHYEARLASARAEVVESILPVLDNLERALAVPGAEESVLFEGVAATRDLFLKKLVELGVEPVGAAGEEFDPEVHEAVDTVPVDNAELDGRIIEVLRRGFRSGDRLVRPAIVRVGRHTG
jgi:molecular chaperone GrpE